jgi:hypothetical protein
VPVAETENGKWKVYSSPEFKQYHETESHNSGEIQQPGD